MRKLYFSICENKNTDQLVTAKLISTFVLATQIDQSLYFLNLNFKPLIIFCGCTARFVSDLVGNPEDQFSHDEAQIEDINPPVDIFKCTIFVGYGRVIQILLVSYLEGTRSAFEPHIFHL